MKILLIGYGKMGKAIAQEAAERGHLITHKIDKQQSQLLDKISCDQVDVAIEFTEPTAAYNNVYTCIKKNIPVVCGTTGWLNQKPAIDKLCKQLNAAFFYSSNFSIGANITLKATEYVSRLINKYPFYKKNIEETHHQNKLDIPSGTAISLAQAILHNEPNKPTVLNDAIIHTTSFTYQTPPKQNPLPCSTNHHPNTSSPHQQNKTTYDNTTNTYTTIYPHHQATNAIQITSKRFENVNGIHQVTYSSEDDDIQITHTAHNRHGFAIGALLAAEWLQMRKGVFSMDDLLQL